jgi:GT2 family glycosyltransferase/2-polyprenyl-3-methyl-5-hydroxy-6-metoxy-1,4-benzoquinol methylase
VRILAFNWHEPYLGLLARTGHEWIVADWPRRWNPAFRPLPAAVRLCSEPEEAAALVDGRGVDLVLAQTAMDLDWLGERTPPLVYLAHDALHNEARHGAGAAERRARVEAALARTGGIFVAISPMKLESWGLPGQVVLPGLDPAEYGGWTGERAAALTVANLLRERGHMLGWEPLRAGLEGLPWTVLGANPGLGEPAADWGALRAAYRAHRVYVHATQWPWEDGYNLALLEAMATGMPVVAWVSPSSPISEGVDGLLADDPAMLGHWTRRLLEDLELGRRLGARARRTVERRFPLGAFVEAWNAVLERAGNGAGSPPRGRPVTPARSPEGSGSLGGGAGRAGATDHARSRPRAPAPSPEGSGSMEAADARRLRIVLATAWTPISTSVYYERALRAAGHRVLTWGPHMDEATLAEWREATERHALKPAGDAAEKIRLLRGLCRPADVPAAPGQPSVGELLRALPRDFRPDLFVWIDGGPGFLPLELERLDCPTVALVGDSHTQLDWRLAYARAFGQVFLMFNRQHQEIFRAGGCRQVGWLPAACDPDVHRAFDVAPAFDVVFVGQTNPRWHPDRVRLLARLRAAGLEVHVSSRVLEEMALALCRGRLVFNRSLAGDLNMRVFEALATGSCLLTDRLAPEAGLGELFQDRVHLVAYGEDDLEALARHYLEHPEERRAIGRAGRRAVLARHTYAHRAAALLAAALGEPAGRAGASAPAALGAYHLNDRPELAALVPAEARRILDVGCAGGRLGRRLKAGTEREVVGIEVDPAAAAEARRHLDEVWPLDLDAVERLPAGGFDCVICADVLEHLRDPERALRLLRRALAPGGRLLASIPNVRHASVLLPLLVDGRFTYRDEGILDRTHLRFFTLQEILALLGRAGFAVGAVAAIRSGAPAALEPAAELVGRLGGDAGRFREEATVIQYLVTAVPAEAAPAVSIVIPVHGRAELTARCLAALAATVDPAETEVIVVDNASPDGTAEVLARAPLPVRVLRNRDNLGFARASNQGAAAARGELLVFLNNDTEPEPGWLAALRQAEAEPGVGIVGARLLYPATRRVQHAGLALDPDGVPDHLHRNVPEDDPRVSAPADLDMVTGACLAIRAAVFRQLGGFDEGYVNGVEDVDLCLAARRAGLRVRYEPRAVLLHHEGASAGRFDRVRDNLARLAAKWAAELAAMPRRPRADFGSDPGPVIAWEGSFFLHHSLAGINRALCRELLRAGVDLTLTPYEPDDLDPAEVPEDAPLKRLEGRPTRQPPALRVRHRFPPSFARRPGERLVVVQPWEFGAPPVDWVEGFRAADEVWVPSEFVRQGYVAAGVPAERVVVVPNGFDPSVFHPRVAPAPLATTRSFRFLFVGGSIHRKGWDLLLRAYAEAFTADDDVCLVIKDHAYYRHRLDEALAALRRTPGAPEVLYLYDSVSPRRLAGLYAACDWLVHPFRGEGFGLPILEALACARPVIVTDAGPVREFCPEEAAVFLPARVVALPEERVDRLPTAGRPTLAEPELPALVRALREAAAAGRPAARERGRRGAAAVHGRYEWSRVAARCAERIRVLLARPPAEPARPAETARGYELLAAGRTAEALACFARALERRDDDVDALVGAAHCALTVDDGASARALLGRVLALDGAHAGARAALLALDGEGALR